MNSCITTPPNYNPNQLARPFIMHQPYVNVTAPADSLKAGTIFADLTTSAPDYGKKQRTTKGEEK